MINSNNTSTNRNLNLNMKEINKILAKAHFKCKYLKK